MIVPSAEVTRDNFSVNAGCVDKYLPDEKDAFDSNVAYTRTTFDPVMGHIVFYTDICNVANSTFT